MRCRGLYYIKKLIFAYGNVFLTKFIINLYSYE